MVILGLLAHSILCVCVCVYVASLILIPLLQGGCECVGGFTHSESTSPGTVYSECAAAAAATALVAVTTLSNLLLFRVRESPRVHLLH